MSKTCKFCGQPVKINEDYYDVFEGMHWLCFHLNFEHGSYDPDEPCDDPSCPWNRIGESYWADYANRNWDIKIVALNNRQLIEMELIGQENEHLPGINIRIGLLGGVTGYKAKTVWYELAEVDNFISSLRIINETGKGKAVLGGMSPGNFDLEIENIDNKGHIVLKYIFGFSEYLHDFRLESLLNSGFEIDIQAIGKIIKGFENIKSNITEMKK